MTESFDLDFERLVRRSFARHLAELDAFVPADIADVRRLGVPRPVTAPRLRARVRATAGAAAAVVLVAVLAGAALLGRQGPAATSTPTASDASAAPTATPAPATSASGVDWMRPAITKDAGPIVAVAAGAHGWVAVSGASTVWHSADGRAWQQAGDAARPLDGFAVTSLVAYPDGFLAAADPLAGAAGAAGAALFSSPNGLDWSRVDTGETFREVGGLRLAWGRSGFVASAGESVWTSTDRSTWSVTMSSALGSAVALAGSPRGYLRLGHGRMMSAGGVFSIAAWSPDGSAWTSRQLVYDFHATDVREAAIGGDGAIAVGKTAQPGLPGVAPQPHVPAALASNDDGVSWTTERDAAALELGGLASDGTTIWGIAADGRLMRSSDGSDWREVSVRGWRHGFPGRIGVAAAGPGGIAVTGQYGFLWFVPAAALTDVAPTPATAPPATMPTPTPDATPSPAVYETPRPLPSWTRATWSSTTLGANRFSALAAGPKGFVGISGEPGKRPTIEYSRDGGPFELADASDPTFEHALIERLVAFSGGFVAVGLLEGFDGGDERRVVWTSSDGLHWQAAPTGTTFDAINLNDLAAGPGGLVIVGSVGLEPAIWFSQDGTSWRRLALDPAVFTGATLYDAAGTERTGWLFGGNLAGKGPAVWRSSDLGHWARESIAGGPNDYAGGFQVASVGIHLLVAPDPLTDRADYYEWRSADGASWTQTPATCSAWIDCLADGARLLRVVADNPEVSLAGTRLEVSRDGLTWTRVPLDAPGPFLPLALGPRGVIVVTDDGQLWYVAVS